MNENDLYSDDSTDMVDSSDSFDDMGFDAPDIDLSQDTNYSDITLETFDSWEDTLPEDIPEDLPEAEEAPETLNLEMEESVELPEDIPEDLPEAEEAPETLDFETDESAELPEDIPEDLPEAEEELETLDFETDESAELPEDIPGDLPEAEEALETLDFEMEESVELPEDIPEDLPEAEEAPETLDLETDESAVLPEPEADIEDLGDFPEEDHAKMPPSLPDGDTTSELASEEDLQESEEGGLVKTLKLSDYKLLELGNSSINAQLEGLKEEYMAQGLSEEEITDKIATDRWLLQQQYLDETFPGQEFSPYAFNGFYENGAADRIKEIEESPSLQALIGGNSLSDASCSPAEQDPLSQRIDRIMDSDLSAEHKLELLNQIKSDMADGAAAQSVPEAQELPQLVDTAEIGTWLKDINPNYDPFDINSPYCNNCGSCAFAVEQHLSGNTDIAATADNIGTVAEMNELTGMEQVPMGPEEIQQYLLDRGPGAHAIVGIDRAEGPGHWFNAVCLDDHTVVALDGQTGEIMDWPPDYGEVTNWDVSVKKEE